MGSRTTDDWILELSLTLSLVLSLRARLSFFLGLDHPVIFQDGHGDDDDDQHDNPVAREKINTLVDSGLLLLMNPRDYNNYPNEESA